MAGVGAGVGWDVVLKMAVVTCLDCRGRSQPILLVGGERSQPILLVGGGRSKNK